MYRAERLIPEVGERIRRYELLEEIGRGGFGVVFRARQLGLGADVAVKVMIPPAMEEEQARHLFERFEQEAKLSKALEHPCAIRVQDYGRTEQGLPFLVTEFIRGRDLSAVIAEERLSTARIIRICNQILGCLGEAHHRGIIHRDLKPSNIKLRDIYGEQDVVKVLDFGIAKVSSELGGLQTQTGLALGTPYYMSPEQCRGTRNLDGRLDLYALGLIMAECISGRRVVRDTETMAIVYAHSGAEPLVFDPEVASSPLFPVIERATRKEREERYPDALAMRAALSKLEGEASKETIAPVSRAEPSPQEPPFTPSALKVPGPQTPRPSKLPLEELAKLETLPYGKTFGEAASPPADGVAPVAGSRRVGLLLVVACLLVAVAVGVLFALRSDTVPRTEQSTVVGEQAAVTPTRAAEAEPVPEEVPVPATRPVPAEAVVEAGGGGAESTTPLRPAEPPPAELPPVEPGLGTGEQSPSEPVAAVLPEAETGGTEVATVSEPSEGPAPAEAGVPEEVEISEPFEAPPPAESVIARIVGEPPHAQVLLGRREVCTSLPCEIELPHGEGDQRVRVRAQGFVEERVRLRRDSSQTYRVHLEAVAPAPPVEEGPALPEVPLEFD